MFIDVSFWNGTMDWTHAQSQGVEGAYIKVSEGAYLDAKFKTNSASCPLKWKGGYHFLNYEVGADGAKQAEFFVRSMAGWNYNLPGALDVEPSAAYHTPFVLSEVLKLCIDFKNRYKELTGHYPMIYVSGSRTKYMPGLQDCPLWVAHYDVAAPTYYLWSNYALWQYSSKGDGAAYGNDAGNLHIDLNKVGAAVETWAAGAVTPTPEPQPLGKQAITTQNLNIRRGAGTTYPVWAVAPAGTVLDVLETRDAGGYTWARVGWQQWAAMKYMRAL